MKRQQGFTLVELLVVIGIVAVLIGILLPALSSARNSAAIVKCESNLHQIVVASLSYAADNKGMLPPGRGDTGSFNYQPSNQLYSWAMGWGTGSNLGGDFQGSNIGRLQQTHYLGRPLPTVTIGTTTNTCDWTQVKVAWCPSSDPSNPIFYQYNWHMAWRDIGSSGTAYLQPWYKKVFNYGHTPDGAVPVLDLPGTINAAGTPTSGATAKPFPNRNFSLVNDNVDLASVMSNVITATAVPAGAMPHDFHNRRAFNLGYIDGHVSTARVANNFVRAGGNYSRDLDMLVSLELVAQGSNAVKQSNPTFGVYNYAPVLTN